MKLLFTTLHVKLLNSTVNIFIQKINTVIHNSFYDKILNNVIHFQTVLKPIKKLCGCENILKVSFTT